MSRALALAALLVVPLASAEPSVQDLPDFAAAEAASKEHRYQDVLDMLSPWEPVDPEERFLRAAEIGRAAYHLGRYETCFTNFAEALKIHNDRTEVGIYYQACSFLSGRDEEAYRVFAALLNSGASDLYMMVSLPGEEDFLAQPQVGDLLDAARQELKVDLESGRFLDVELGSSRDEVEAALGGDFGDDAAVFVRAGPAVLWALQFDEQGLLARVIIEHEQVLRYSRYALDLGKAQGLLEADSASRAATLAASTLKWPVRRVREGDLELVDIDFGSHGVALRYGEPVRVLPGKWGATDIVVTSIELRRR